MPQPHTKATHNKFSVSRPSVCSLPWDCLLRIGATSFLREWTANNQPKQEIYVRSSPLRRSSLCGAERFGRPKRTLLPSKPKIHRLYLHYMYQIDRPRVKENLDCCMLFLALVAGQERRLALPITEKNRSGPHSTSSEPALSTVEGAGPDVQITSLVS